MAVGKTSTARSVIRHGNFRVQMMKIGKKEYAYTYDSAKKWVVTGRYDLNECGGLDGRIESGDVMKVYLNRIMRDIKPEVIVFEAVMYGHTFKFGSEIAQIARRYGYEYIGVSLEPGIDAVLQNMYGRNKGKPIDEVRLINMYISNSKATQTLRKHGIFCDSIDSMKYPIEEMYKIVEKYTE